MAAGTPLIAAAASVAVIALGAGIFLLAPRDSTPDGPAQRQADVAVETLATDDPLAAFRQMIETGSFGDRNSALGGLIKFGSDASNTDQDRIEALLLAARMADPETFDADHSGFRSPDPSTARMLYGRAADLGSTAARNASARLEQ